MSDCTCGFGGFHDDANPRCALNAVVQVDVQGVPSPYRFTVSVDDYAGEWIVFVAEAGALDAYCVSDGFPTEAEARSHAALVLAALHQATLEGDAP